MNIPEQIGDFRIKGLIGRGPVGSVYRAEQVSLGRVVAIKILAPERSESPQQTRLFFQNARIAANIFHNNIVKIFSTGHTDNYYYVICEYVDGMNLSDYIEEHGKFSPEESVQVIRRLANVLSTAVDANCPHLNLKPENVLLSTDQRIKVSDFATKTPMGTQNRIFHTNVEAEYFRSPEQLSSPSKGDMSSDIYSLGLLWYYMLTGRPPFKAKTFTELLQKHQTVLIPALVIKSNMLSDESLKMIENIVNKMVAKSPAERYQSPGELLGAVDLIGVVNRDDTKGVLEREIVAGLGLSGKAVDKASPDVLSQKPLSRQRSESSDKWHQIVRKKRLVLVADDIASARHLYKTVVQGAGFDVVTAQDGLEAVKILEEKVPDLAILDIGMPRMNGLQVLKNMTARKCPTKFIVVTGHKDRDTVLAASRHKLFSYITKPVNINELRQRIASAMANEAPERLKVKDPPAPIKRKKPPVNQSSSSAEELKSLANDIIALTVDQNEYTRIILKTLLESLNIKVIGLEDGLEAIEIAQKGQVNIIVAGAKMRACHPQDFIKKIRQDLKMATPILYAGDLDAEALFNNVAHYSFPIRNEEILEKVPSLLTRVARAHRQHHSTEFIRMVMKQQIAKQKPLEDLMSLAVKLSELGELDQVPFREKIKFYPENQLKQLILRFLNKQPKDKFFANVFMAYQSGDYFTRSFCIELLEKTLPQAKLCAAFENMLGDVDYRIRLQIIKILTRMDLAASREMLVGFLEDPLFRVRSEAIDGIKAAEPGQIIVPLVKYCGEHAISFPSELAFVVDTFKQPAQTKILEELLHNESVPVRQYIISLLGKSGSPLYLKTLSRQMNAEDVAVRMAAITALARLPKNEKTLEVLVSAVYDSSEKIREVALSAIRHFRLSPFAEELVDLQIKSGIPMPQHYAELIRKFNNGNELEVGLFIEQLYKKDESAKKLIENFLRSRLASLALLEEYIKGIFDVNSNRRTIAAKELAAALFAEKPKGG